jgi:hypothetical protein
METEHLTQERIGENQSRFREANERIELAADKMGLMGHVPFICECADSACFEIVRLSIEGYEEVRDNPRLFFTAPGHQAIALNADAGVVVGEGDGYVLVEKIGVAGDVAAEDYSAKNGSDEAT